MNSSQQYTDLYAEWRQTICQHSSPLMNAHRDEACRRLAQTGFPTVKDERYKYTDIGRLMEPDYGLNLGRLDIQADPYEAFRCDVPNMSTSLFFVVNDAFYDSAPTTRLPQGVVVGSLARLSHETGLADGFYNRLAGQDDDALTALNTMLAQDGLLVYVPRGVVVERAIQVINMLKAPPRLNADPQADAEAAGMMVNRRVLVVAEEGAQVTLLFCDHTADDRRFLATQVIEVFAGQGATVNLYCLEETHARNVRLSNVYVEQQQQSAVSHNVVTLHNGVTRNKLDLRLVGEGASCWLGGCVVADKQQHVDNNTLIAHCAPHCTSEQLYKYVLDGSAVGAFAGRIYVAPGAQQTASQMNNQNICASEQARMYTQPMLEIYADDVRCAHGATVGQLNDAALFYMRQRGISEQEARTMLQMAFVNQVVDHIELPALRDRLRYLVEKRFRGELSKCEGCRLCR